MHLGGIVFLYDKGEIKLTTLNHGFSGCAFKSLGAFFQHFMQSRLLGWRPTKTWSLNLYDLISSTSALKTLAFSNVLKNTAARILPIFRQ